MIPILYEKDEKTFTSNGVCRLPDVIECVVTEERNGIFECDFSYPVDGINFDLIQLGRIIACTHDSTGIIQPFDIVSCEKPIDGIVTFHAVHISYRQSFITVSSGNTNINSLSEAFAMLATSEPANDFAYETDRTVTAYMAAADGEPRSVRQFLGGVEGSILDTYGGEYKWDKFKVILDAQRGVYRDTIIRYGVNLLEYDEEIDYSETYNTVIPFWRGDDGKGNDLIIKGVVVTNLNSTTFDGRERCIPLDLSDKFEDKPTITQIGNLAGDLLANSKPWNPKTSISIKFVDFRDIEEYKDIAPLMQCNLCDWVTVSFPKYNQAGQYKIVKTVYNVLLDRYDELELGSLQTTLSEALGVSDNLTSSYSIGVQNLSPTYTRTSGTPQAGVTVTGQRWGQVVELSFAFQRYSASAGTDMAVGSLSGVPAPISSHVRGVSYNGSTIGILDFIPSKDLSVRVNAAVTTSTTSYFHFTIVYITNE